MAKYPGREANNAAGGWAGGEKGLKAFSEETVKAGVALPKELPSKGPGAPRKQLPPSLDIRLAKDFGGAAGGFPGGEVGVRMFTETGKVPKAVRPPTVGLGGYLALAVAGGYAACYAITGDLNPADWEFVSASNAPAAIVAEAPGSKKRLVVVPSVAVPSAVVTAVAPPAAVVGGVVLAGVGLAAAARKAAETARNVAILALFVAVVGAMGSHILGLI